MQAENYPLTGAADEKDYEMHKKKVAYIKAKLDVIEAERGDAERAHSDEDNLWEMVLNWIALGVDESAELASLALKTKEIKFPRWCA